MKDNINKKMTEMFKGYTDYSEEEYQSIWKSALIVVDTNILLNFYRYSEDTRNEMFKTLENLKNRIWIPYYVAKEYFSNKNNVIFNSYDEYKKLTETIKDAFKNAENEINQRKNTQLKCKSRLISILEESNKKICALLEKEKDEKKPYYEENPIENDIITLFDTAIGQPFSNEIFEKIKAEGIKRIEEKTPPGYKDKDKTENGDYYIFYSLIEKSKESKKNIIFVTDDVKEDWFNIINGEKHGGRYELLNEFYRETGNLLLIYTSDGFIKAYSKNITKADINKEIVDELINTRKKNSTIYNYKYYDDYAIIDNIRNSISHDTREIKYYIDDLIYLIKKLDISESQKYKYLNLLYDYKQKKLEGKDFDKEHLLNLLNSIIFSYSNSKKVTNHLNDFRDMYIQEIQNLIISNKSMEIFSSYHRLTNTLKHHIEYLDEVSVKGAYKLQLDLSYMLEMVQNTLTKKDDSSSLKEQIIGRLEKIINIL